jgi:hypothetical protein
VAEREPPERPERTPEDLSDEERARGRRVLVTRLQVGGIVFLGVVALGLLPTALSAISPELGRRAAGAAWILAPLAGLALVLFAALRLRR